MSNQVLDASKVFHSVFIPDPLGQNHEAIKTLLQIVKTCIGPSAKPKIVQNNSGGHVTVTSSSMRLFNVITAKSLIVKFIISAVKSHLSTFGNGGLYCCLLTSFIVENSLKSSLPNGILSNLNSSFGRFFTTLLTQQDSYFQETLDLSSINHLQTVICSIIRSKPSCLLTKANESHLCLLLLKAFLNSIPDRVVCEKIIIPVNIAYCTQTGISPEKSELISGLLLKYSELSKSETILQNLKNRDILIVLFSSSLAGDVNLPSKQVQECQVSLWREILKHLLTICQKLISDGIQVVFCQKVIHPTIKKHLWENGILPIDRLGFESSNNVQKISGAVPVSSLTETCFTYGLLTYIDIVNIGKEKRLLLQNNTTPFWTISICNYHEESLCETKIVCEQVLDTLYRLLKNPNVCYGAGCTEVYIAHLLREKVMKNLSELSMEHYSPPSTVIQSLDLFINSIYNLAFAINKGSRLDLISDNVFHHLWKFQFDVFPSGDITCQCGKYAAKSVPSNSWQFLDGTSTLVEDNSIKEADSNSPALNAVVLDELSSKVNACSVAFETSSSLLNIGLCIISER